MAKRISDAERPRYVIYATARLPTDSHPRQYIPVFTDPAYAKRWLMRMLSNVDWSRNGNHISTNTSLHLRSEQLEDILNAPDSEDPLKPDDFRAIQQFKHGGWDIRATPPSPEPEDDEPVDDKPGTDDAPKPVAVKKAPKAPKASKASVPDGYVTITDLAATWGMKASDCRAMLRASDLVKPDYGWSFGPDEIPKIKKLCGVKG
jgi:hypothetical protein